MVEEILVGLLKLTASHRDVLLLVHGSHVGSGFWTQHRVIARRMFQRQFQTRMQSFPISSFDSESFLRLLFLEHHSESRVYDVCIRMVLIGSVYLHDFL